MSSAVAVGVGVGSVAGGEPQPMSPAGTVTLCELTVEADATAAVPVTAAIENATARTAFRVLVLTTKKPSFEHVSACRVSVKIARCVCQDPGLRCYKITHCETSHTDSWGAVVSSSVTENSGSLPLTADDQVTYKAIAAGEEVDEVLARRLASIGLVVPNPYEPGRWVAVDPRAAAQQLLSVEQEALAGSLERMRQVPILESLYSHFDPHRLYGGPGSEFLPTMAQMNDRLGQISAHAGREICSVQPAPPAERVPAARQLGSDRSLALLRGGRVSMRLVYGTGVLADEDTRVYADEFISSGGEIKVSSSRDPRMVIIDGRDLFIDDFIHDEAEPHSGWHVRDRCAVAWAHVVFERLWGRATWWSEALAKSGDSRLTSRQLDILALYEAGLDQPKAARELGVSSRTVANELADARASLGLSTTYQLMGWYGRWIAKQH
ncbi:hypothetical protein ACFVWX_32245 [Streptomyces sp. NPDC058220]|uniref:hypothetical protein n=1 Tax=Streptomyces sp. NPDC058220 TaxID=3346387 RepID=UPI0036E02784